MTTIFDPPTRERLISRVTTVRADNQARWGKMNACQMIEHCIRWNRWVLGMEEVIPYRQGLLGLLFGKSALRSIVKDDAPLDRNLSTFGALRVADANGDIRLKRDEWISLIADFAHFDNPGFIHGFFGEMDREQIGILAYKHHDHHLRQFGL